MKPWQIVLAGCIVGSVGCVDSVVSRARIEPEPVKEPVAAKTIGDLSTIGNSAAIPVSGVGLVVGLDGAGGDAPPGMYRDILKDFLQKRGFENVGEILKSPNHAMVLVAALIPPGARKGEMIDIQVSLPDGSKAKSLRGGHLELCNLITFDTLDNVRNAVAKNSDNKPTGRGNALLPGSTLVKAEGMLSPSPERKADEKRPRDKKPAEKKAADADAADGGDEGDWKSAWVWGGGRCEVPNQFHVVLNPDQQRYAVATTAANRINEVFHAGGADQVAVAKSKEIIVLTVPPMYKLNVPHFLRVLRNIPLDNRLITVATMQKWEEELKEPATTVAAAVRLEAMGADAKPNLKAALDSPYPLVRFAAAQSLCYLGESSVADELGKLAEGHPALQAYCLTALASLNEAACFYKLQDLMASAIPEVRYGAFRALREQDPNQEGIRGQRLAHSFALHKVAPNSPPMVHMLTEKRCEIVLFGNTPALVAPYSFSVGSEWTVTAHEGDGVVTINRFSVKGGNRAEQCSPNLDEVVRTLAKMGAGYPETVQLLKMADRTRSLNCKLAVQALPRALKVIDLAEAGKADPTFATEADMMKKSETPIEAPNFYSPLAVKSPVMMH